MSKFIIAGALLTLGVVAIAIWAFWPVPSGPAVVPSDSSETTTETPATSTRTVIGTSVEARPIEAYTFGTGETDLLFVGGIHGGYEANTVRLAEAMIEEFQSNSSVIPDSVTVHIIPNLNPDGYAVVSTASAQARRFNANDVDLNRNFGCRWKPESTWRSAVVSAGSAPFSEPEAAALRDYVAMVKPNAAVFWHSIGNAVFTSECGNGVLGATQLLMNTYASAANYEAAGLWTAYPVTGDAEGWLASIGIPAVTVELELRESIEWDRNWAGVLATLELYR